MRLLVTLLLWATCSCARASEADTLLRRGQLSAALDAARNQAAANPDDLASHELIIDMLAATGRANEAVRAYEDRAAASPGSADAWYLVGRARPDPDGSDEAFGKALALDPTHARAWMGRAAVLRSHGVLGGAADAYGRAIERDPHLAEAWDGLRSTLLARGDRAAAAEVATRALAQVPDDPDAWLGAAALDPGHAAELLSRGATEVPDDPRLPATLARVRFDGRDWPGAAGAYSRALAIAPARADLRVEAALVDEIRTGVLTPEAAAALLEVRSAAGTPIGRLMERLDAIAVANPHSGWVRLVRGNLRSASPDPEMVARGEDDLRAAVTRLPSSPEAWSALGLFLLGHHRAADARPLLEHASAARPFDVSLAVAAAMATAEAGDPDAAEAALRDAWNRFPESTGPVLGLARVRLARGDAEAAFEVLAAGIRQNPDPDLVIALAATAREAGRPEEAARLLETLGRQQADPRLIEAARALRAQGN